MKFIYLIAALELDPYYIDKNIAQWKTFIASFYKHHYGSIIMTSIALNSIHAISLIAHHWLFLSP